MFMCTLLFVLPAQSLMRPKFSDGKICQTIFSIFCRFFFVKNSGAKPLPYRPLLTWKTLQRKFPWDMLLLIAGSFAMAGGIEVIKISL